MNGIGSSGGALRDGVVAGAAATATMSAVMLAARQMGVMGKNPPRQMTDVVLDSVRHEQSPAWLRNGLATTSHFAFGAALGAIFALAHQRYPEPGGLLPRGLVVASLVWFISYQGWVPALGLMPPHGAISLGARLRCSWHTGSTAQRSRYAWAGGGHAATR